jgi:hypothetical protein
VEDFIKVETETNTKRQNHFLQNISMETGAETWKWPKKTPDL